MFWTGLSEGCLGVIAGFYFRLKALAPQLSTHSIPSSFGCCGHSRCCCPLIWIHFEVRHQGIRFPLAPDGIFQSFLFGLSDSHQCVTQVKLEPTELLIELRPRSGLGRICRGWGNHIGLAYSLRGQQRLRQLVQEFPRYARLLFGNGFSGPLFLGLRFRRVVDLRLTSLAP